MFFSWGLSRTKNSLVAHPLLSFRGGEVFKGKPKTPPICLPAEIYRSSLVFCSSVLIARLQKSLWETFPRAAFLWFPCVLVGFPGQRTLALFGATRFEPESKPAIKTVNPEPSEEAPRRPQLLLAEWLTWVLHRERKEGRQQPERKQMFDLAWRWGLSMLLLQWPR